MPDPSGNNTTADHPTGLADQHRGADQQDSEEQEDQQDSEEHEDQQEDSTDNPLNLHTITCNGFSATSDAFAVDDSSNHIWFCSLLAGREALIAITAAMLKSNPDPVHLVQGVENNISGNYHPYQVPPESIGTWVRQVMPLRSGKGHHAMAYSRKAHPAFESPDFLLLADSEERAPTMHYRSLDIRTQIPIHPSWTDWLWQRSLLKNESRRLNSHGIIAYWCNPDQESIQADITLAVADGRLTVPPDTQDAPSHQHQAREGPPDRRRGRRPAPTPRTQPTGGTPT